MDFDLDEGASIWSNNANKKRHHTVGDWVNIKSQDSSMDARCIRINIIVKLKILNDNTQYTCAWLAPSRILLTHLLYALGHSVIRPVYICIYVFDTKSNNGQCSSKRIDHFYFTFCVSKHVSVRVQKFQQNFDNNYYWAWAAIDWTVAISHTYAMQMIFIACDVKPIWSFGISLTTIKYVVLG